MNHETFKTIVVLAIQVAMIGCLGWSIRPTLRNPRYRIVVSGLRARHFGMGLAIIIPTLIAGAFLVAEVPLMDIGWFMFIGGGSNVALATPASESAPSVSKALPLALIAIVALIAPMAAFREERMFRRGTERQSARRRWTRQVIFGLVHMIMGIPLGAALSLSFAGGGLMRVYRRRFATTRSRHQAILESTRTHLAYNLVMLILVTAGTMILLLHHTGAA